MDTTFIESAAGDAPNTRSQTAFVSLINDTWREGASRYIGCGKLLGEANEELPRSVFNSMVKTKLDFEASVARKLMCIAANETLCAHVHKLPPCWSTLYELSQLPENTLKTAFADGRIHPRMKRKEAIALKPPKQTTARPTAAKSAELNTAWKTASVAQRQTFLNGLGLCAAMSKALAAELRDRLNVAGASESTDFATYCTDKLHSALACIEQPTDESSRIAALLGCIAKMAEAKGVSRSAVVIVESKKISRAES